MPGQLQVLPRGLLGFFQIKNGGANPQDLSTQLGAGIDLRDWYLETNSEQTLAPATYSLATGTGGWFGFTANTLVVPDREWWFVANFTIRAFIGNAADRLFDFRPGMQINSSVARYEALGVSENYAGLQATAAVAPPATLHTTARQFWAPPGAILGFMCSLSTAVTTIPVTGDLRYTRLPI